MARCGEGIQGGCEKEKILPMNCDDDVAGIDE